jgi:hypothetical protein
MARMVMDCRSMPSESKCSLTIIGEPDEVVRAAAQHAADVHDHENDEAFREQLRGSLVEESEWRANEPAAMA